MKNVLLLVHDDSGQEARLQVAVDLTRALSGHLTCLDLTYVPPIIGGGVTEDAYVMADLLTAEAPREAENKHRVQVRLRNEDIHWDWRDAAGDAAPELRSAAEWADVIVINRHLDDFSTINMRRAASELIVKSRRPVLAVPSSSDRLDMTSALIAWDGSPEAGAALRAAVPLLLKARQVVLLEVLDGSIDTPAEEAVTYLLRHDINAVVQRTVCTDGQRASDVMLEHATNGHFGYVVMGGFSHARFVEALFGGVTRAMLTMSPIPVFYAHA